MPDQFGSSYAVDADAGYDASRLKGKSVIITGGQFDNNGVLAQRCSTISRGKWIR